MKQKLDAEARAEAIKAEAAKPFARYKCVRLALATLSWASWVVGHPTRLPCFIAFSHGRCWLLDIRTFLFVL